MLDCPWLPVQISPFLAPTDLIAATDTLPPPDEMLRTRFTQPLASSAIAQAAGPSRFAVQTVLETDSTNTDLLRRARQQAPSQPLLLAALAQRAGRGRLGRRWSAAAGSSLLFSLTVPLTRPAAHLPAVTLACGLALAETLRAADVPAAVKWPNDILLDERKLAGVLTELATDAHGARTLVIGVGLNLWADAAMRDQTGKPLAVLSEHLPLAQLAGARELWIGRLAAAVGQAVQLYLAHGFVPLQPRFMRMLAGVGQPADLIEHGSRAASGRLLGVDGEGRLLLDVDGRVRVITSGEVSLRVHPARAPVSPAAAVPAAPWPRRPRAVQESP